MYGRLREFIRHVLLAEAALGTDLVTIDKESVMNLFTPTGKWYKPREVDVFCPYTIKTKFETKGLSPQVRAVIEKYSPGVFTVVDVVKKDIRLGDGDDNTVITMSDADREWVWNDMASQIAAAMKGKGIVAVAPAASSSVMPFAVAARVSELLGCQMIEPLKKGTRYLKINPFAYLKWLRQKERTPEEREKFKKQLQKNLATMKGKERLSIAADLNVKTRDYFYGIHEVDVDMLRGLSAKGALLIVDDNFDSGSTFVDIKATITDAPGAPPMLDKEGNVVLDSEGRPAKRDLDLKVYFAAGFRINRPSSDTAEKRKEREAARPALEAMKAAMQRYAAAMKGNPSTVAYPPEPGQSEYKIGDIVAVNMRGKAMKGVVEEINPGQKMSVNTGADGMLRLSLSPDILNKMREKPPEMVGEIYRRVLARLGRSL